MKVLIIIICVILFVAFGLFMFVIWHLKWLDKQSPVGVWTVENEGISFILQFEHGLKEELKEGIYKQIAKGQDGSEKREFGHWWSQRQQLRMLILATDIKNHPRFGQDTVYEIWYVGPDIIKINGPGRHELVYQRAPEGTVVVFDDSVDPVDPNDKE